MTEEPPPLPSQILPPCLLKSFPYIGPSHSSLSFLALRQFFGEQLCVTVQDVEGFDGLGSMCD